MPKIWTFVKDAKAPPATLMDAPENVACVVRYGLEYPLAIRIRRGYQAFSVGSTGLPFSVTGQAIDYKFEDYYRPPAENPLPADLKAAEPYRLVKLKTLKRFYWKTPDNMVWSLSEVGTVLLEGAASSSLLSYAVTSVSNLTAVLTEV